MTVVSVPAAASGDCVQILTMETDRENEEGTAHFQSVRQLPRVSLQDKQVEEAINDSYRLMYQDKRNRQIKELFDSWQETAAEDAICEDRVTCTYADTRMLSLTVCCADETGNGERRLHQFSISYDLKNSQRILLSDVLAKDGSAARDAAVLLRGKLQESPVFSELYDPSQAAVYAEQKVGSGEDWYLTEDSLVFFFNPEEIAPSSEGIIELAIPYEELGGLVMQDYMEAGEPIDVQNICLSGLSAADDSRFPSFAKSVGKLPAAEKN